MFLFRAIEFLFQISTAVFIVLILQVSVGGRTLEDFFLSFVQTSETTAPVRDLAYSGAKKLESLGFEIPKEDPERTTNSKTEKKEALIKGHPIITPILEPLVKNLSQELGSALEKTNTDEE